MDHEQVKPEASLADSPGHCFFIGLAIGLVIAATLTIVSVVTRFSEAEIVREGHGHWAPMKSGEPGFRWNSKCGEVPKKD